MARAGRIALVIVILLLSRKLVCSRERMWDDFLAVIERLRVKAPLERVVEASKIGELPEWSLNGMLLRLSKKKIG